MSDIGRPDRIVPDAIERGLGLFDSLHAIPKGSTLAQRSGRIDPRWTDGASASSVPSAESASKWRPPLVRLDGSHKTPAIALGF